MHLFIEAGEIFIQWLFEANMQGGSCLQMCIRDRPKHIIYSPQTDGLSTPNA